MEIPRRGAAQPLGRAEPAEEPASTRWEEIENSPEFVQLVSARRRFVLPATIFFIVYYFLLPLGNGLATGFMRTNVIGNVNVAYLFALSQFVVAWVLAYFYIRRANSVFDRLAAAVGRRLEGTRWVRP